MADGGAEYRIGDAREELADLPANSAQLVHLDDAWARPKRCGGMGVEYPTHDVEVSFDIVDACWRVLEEGYRVHLGNPGGKDGLVWAYRAGFDSVDTTTVFQNQYWHYLGALERATEETQTPTDDTNQLSLGEIA